MDSEWTYNENCKIGFMQPDTEAYNWYDELIRIPCGQIGVYCCFRGFVKLTRSI